MDIDSDLTELSDLDDESPPPAPVPQPPAPVPVPLAQKKPQPVLVEPGAIVLKPGERLEGGTLGTYPILSLIVLFP